MQYVLGNMLNGGGINPDGLSLDLQFAADKTFSKPSSLAAGETAITSRRGPSATFLRSSAATEVGPDGLIRYAPENLVIGSSAAAFSAANATRGTSTILGIDGVALTSCTSLNANGNRVGTSLITIAPNQIYTLSAYMAAGTSSFGGLVADNFPTGVGAIFNLTGSGSVVSSAAVSGTVISTSIQRIGTTELYRCSITFSFTSITSAAVGFGVSNGSTYAFSIFPSASSGTVNAGAIQLERHTSARTYIPTTTAAVYAPRFDHDPVTLACKGLLIEEGRTNLVSRSQEFSNWSFQNSTLGSSAIAPDGNNTANSVAFQNSTSTPTAFYSYMARLVSVSVTAGQQYTVSFYVKASTNTSINIGTNGQTSGLNNSGALVNVTTSWTRVSFTLTAAANDSGLFAIIGSGFNGVSTYLSARTIEIWGAQVEAGSFPTSYIPTTTAPLTRSADVCSITGGDFSRFWNRFAGTCIIGVGSSLGSNPRFISNLLSARTLEIYGMGNIDFFEASGANEVRIVTSPTYPIKVGLAYAINDYQSAYNGLLGGSDTNTGGTIPNATELHVGTLGGTSARLTGHIQFIRYYKKRLPDAKLVTLTT